MRIALCLSGQIRSIDLTIQNLINNVKIPNNCDVFCHCWHDYNNSKYTNYYNPTDNEFVKYGSYSYENIQKVIENIKPVSFCFEHPFIPQNTRSMFYSIKKSNDLKSQYEIMNGFEYDIVIRSRYDLLFYEILKLDSVEDNTVYLSSRPGGCGGMNDCFAYGDSRTMNIYSDLYSHHKDNPRINEPCPEGILYDFLKYKNIEIKEPIGSITLIREDRSEILINPMG